MGKVDWSKAPEGAEFSVRAGFYRILDGSLGVWNPMICIWVASDLDITWARRQGCYELRPSNCKVSADCVKSPNHYQLMGGIELIEIIARSMTKEQWKGFCLGNMLKYRIRAGKKGCLQQDIDKANFYGELYEMHKGKCYE